MEDTQTSPAMNAKERQIAMPKYRTGTKIRRFESATKEEAV